MATKTPRGGRRTTGAKNADLAPHPDGTRPAFTFVEPMVDIEDDQPDRWAALIDNWQDDNTRLLLLRQAPEWIWDPDSGQKIKAKGYLEDLPPDNRNYEEYIKSKYGGGSYQAVRREDGQFVQGINIEIGSCRPKLPEEDTSGRPPQSAPEAAGTRTLPDGELHENLPIGGTDDQFMARLERIMLLQAVIERRMQLVQKQVQPSANDPGWAMANTLLNNLLTQRTETADPVTMVTKLAEAQRAIVEAMPSTGNGEGWAGVVGQVANTIGKVLDAKTALGLGAPRRPPTLPPPRRPELPHHPDGIEPPMPQAPANGTGPQPLEVYSPEVGGSTETGEELPMTMDARTAAATAIENIAGVYMTDPDTPPQDVVALLDNTLQISREIRAQLAPAYSTLETAAKARLGEYFSYFAPEARRDEVQKFRAWLTQVFNLFVDPDRTPSLIGGVGQTGPTL